MELSQSWSKLSIWCHQTTSIFFFDLLNIFGKCKQVPFHDTLNFNFICIFIYWEFSSTVWILDFAISTCIIGYRLSVASVSSCKMQFKPILTHKMNLLQKDASTCSDSVLSEMMPDIAMATASMTQMSLNDLDLSAHGDLELDLGDGTNHSGTCTLYIWPRCSTWYARLYTMACYHTRSEENLSCCSQDDYFV